MTRFLLFGILVLVAFSHAHSQKDSVATYLDPIEINAIRISTSKLSSPFAVATYQATAVQQTRQQLSLQEYINHVPGVFSLNANNYAQDLRISIRGFGARSAFGIRGIKIIVDGIPETTPDGQGQIDNINLGIIEKIEILKGPSAALYGNAAGGVIDIQTDRSFTNNFIEAGTTFGSYNFEQYQLKGGLVFDKTKLIVQGTHTATSGYRPLSDLKNTNVNLRLFQDLSNKSKLDWQVNYTNSPKANDPGGLNLEEVEDNRRQARQRNIDFKTGEKIKQFKTAVRFRHQFDSKKSLQLYSFYTRRDFQGLLPFENGGWIELARNYFGQGGHYQVNGSVANGDNTLLIGYELAFQQDERQRFLNQEGIKGDVVLDQIETFSNIGIYITDHFRFNKWLITAGLRMDLNYLRVADELPIDGIQSDNIDLSTVNPSVGINYQLNRKLHLYGSYRSGFETPSLSELSANPDGEAGFNTSLKPQRSYNYEMGIKGLISPSFDFDVTAFYVDTKNDLVPFQLAAFPGRSFFRNAGATSRSGMELLARYLLNDNFTTELSYTFSNLRYKKYLLPDGDFKNNLLPGIPKHFASVVSTYMHENGFHIRLQHRFIDEILTNDANSVKVDPYHITDVSLGYRVKAKGFQLLPFFGLNNIFDTRYNDNIRINAFGGRYYEPAAGINVYGGVRVKVAD